MHSCSVQHKGATRVLMSYASNLIVHSIVNQRVNLYIEALPHHSNQISHCT